MLETELRRCYLAACGRALSDLRLFSRNVGFFKTAGGGGFRAGVKGQADVYGFYRNHKTPSGHLVTIPIEIELKRYGRPLKPEQEHWRDWCKEWGIPYLLLEEKTKDSTPADTIGAWVNETRGFLATII